MLNVQAYYCFDISTINRRQQQKYIVLHFKPDSIRFCCVKHTESHSLELYFGINFICIAAV